MTQAHQIAPGQAGDTLIQAISCGGRESHNSDVALVVGAFALNPSSYKLAKATVSFKFSVVVANGTSPLTTGIKLYNITDSQDVTSSIISIVDSTDPTKYEVSLVVGAAAGQIKIGVEKIYECRIYLDAPPVNPITDTIELFKAEVRAIFTVL